MSLPSSVTLSSRFSLPRVGLRLPDRVVSSLGALLGISSIALVCSLMARGGVETALLVAPMGAAAVLMFAVPTSPLVQPWPVMGGNIISAFVGVTVAHWVPQVQLAAGLAVGCAILVMSLCRCLHPPGGASALVAVIGGPAIHASGYAFAYITIGTNAAVLLAVGLLFHRVCGRSYPHRQVQSPAVKFPPPEPVAFTQDDLEKALTETGVTLDIRREELTQLLQAVERHAAQRRVQARP